MFKRIKDQCAICSEGFSVALERTPLGECQVKYTERNKVYLAQFEDLDPEEDGVIIYCATLRRLDNPYPDGARNNDAILTNISRALEFLEIQHQLS